MKYATKNGTRATSKLSAEDEADLRGIARADKLMKDIEEGRVEPKLLKLKFVQPSPAGHNVA